MISVLATTLIIGSILGVIVGLTSRHQHTPRLQGAVSSGSSSGSISSTLVVSGSGESVIISSSKTSLPSGPSQSSSGGSSSRASTGVETDLSVQSPGNGHGGGDSRSTLNLGGIPSKTIHGEITSTLGASSVQSPGSGSGGDSNRGTTKELASTPTGSRPTTTPDPTATSFDGLVQSVGLTGSPADGEGHFKGPGPLVASQFADTRPPIRL